MTVCFQHTDRPAETVYTLYDEGTLVEIALCHNCRDATALACFVHEHLLPSEYEIINIDQCGDVEEDLKEEEEYD